MEPSQNGSPVHKKARVSLTVMPRDWTCEEEGVLINALKELVVEGWRVGTDFKPGFLQRLEAALLAEFPSSGITGDQHIYLKVKEWEEQYKLVCKVKDLPKFNWLYDDQMLEAEDDAWDYYIKWYPELETFRHESVSYFEDWEEIFWNDQATGEYAVSSTGSNFHSGTATPSQRGRRAENKGVTTSPGQTSKTTTKQKPKRKKRKSSNPSSSLGPFIAVCGKFQEFNSTFVNIVNQLTEDQNYRITADQNSGSNNCQSVMDAVEKTTELSVENQIYASYKILHNPHDTDLFLKMTEELQGAFIQKILDGKLG